MCTLHGQKLRTTFEELLDLQSVTKRACAPSRSDDTYCPQCYQLGELKKKETNLLTEKENSKILKLETHLETANKQSVFMKLTKSSLSNGDFGTETCIAVQDFTQIQVQGTFYQDLIICFYFFRDTGFERKYLHYVAAKSSDKNDINFVMHSWTNLFENGKLEGIKKKFSCGAMEARNILK